MFRDKEFALRVARSIRKLSGHLDEVKIMDFCGTHEWTITHYGIRSMMPENVELVAGPGCPVCITPGYYVKAAVKLAMEGIRVFTYGDAYKLPTGRREEPSSLEEARSMGGKVEIVYSVMDAVKKSRDGRESVFLAVGFETTAPATFIPLKHGEAPNNLSFLVAHRLTPPITRYVLDNFPDNPISGIIAPGHVSTIIGAKAWSFLPKEYGVPTVVSGFEPVDVLLSILEILRQIRDGRPRLVNEYSRAVSWDGNLQAQKLFRDVAQVSDAVWRGIGVVPESGLILSEVYKEQDAETRYGIDDEGWDDLPPGCRCAQVTLGMIKPTDCPMFMKSCTPESPYGPCMVSSEGTCNIWAKHSGASVINLPN